MQDELTVDPTSPFTAWPKLFATMTYPTEPERWPGFVSLFEMRAADYLDRGVTRDLNVQPDDVALQAALTGPGQLAGAVLCFAAQLHLFHPQRPASLNRAWNILARDNRSRSIRKPKHKSGFFDNVWSKWKSVSPLYAAFLVSKSIQIEEQGTGGHYDRWGANELHEFLGWVAWFRRWGTTTKADKARHPLLADSDTLCVAAGIDPIEPPLSAIRPERLTGQVTGL